MVPKLDKITWKQWACHFGELYPHALGNRRSLKLSETALFLSSQDEAEWLSKEEYVFKLNIFHMLVLLCVIVYLLLLLLFLSFHFWISQHFWVKKIINVIHSVNCSFVLTSYGKERVPGRLLPMSHKVSMPLNCKTEIIPILLSSTCQKFNILDNFNEE